MRRRKLLFALAAFAILFIAAMGTGCRKDNNSETSSIVATWHCVGEGEFGDIVKTTIDINENGTMALTIVSSIDNEVYTRNAIWKDDGKVFSYAFIQEEDFFDCPEDYYYEHEYKIEGNTLAFYFEGELEYEFTK